MAHRRYRIYRGLLWILIAIIATMTYIYTLRRHKNCAPPFSYAVQLRNFANSSSGKFWNPGEVLRLGHEGLPFPVEDTGDLPTAHNTASTCKKRSKYIFFVNSTPGNFYRRAIMRSCLSNPIFSTYYRWTTVFFVGLSADSATAKQVEEEAAQHGDVVVLPFQDSFTNRTFKFVYGMKWTIENCPSTEYVVKLDDDMVVNVSMVMNYLRAHSTSEKLECHCNVYKNALVVRDVKSKWYLSEKTYPKKMFPPYCAGGVGLFKSSALRGLYNASFYLPFHPIDDVYVTGDSSLIAGVKLIEINKLVSFSGYDWSGVTSGKSMLSQLYYPELSELAWRIISESLTRKKRQKRKQRRLIFRLPGTKMTNK
ncbi:beta-1,3-galactosyltransferase 1-like [Ixodes scapularis]|uniref:beta-1,3-galactosyltransferase 1-like n=1 Tax=Ixodes scapularis TaxID=6945 RepID=UPI001A9E87FB|nr:beta-1,3-galactosyltransferase 1-like [Ixodes scapularis]